MTMQGRACRHTEIRRCRAGLIGGWCGRTRSTAPRLFWRAPNPDVDADLLVNTAGRSITLNFSVDVTSGHVEPTRTFRIAAEDGTAVNGSHYTMTTPVTGTFDSTTGIYEVSIATIARQDHGPDPRRFTITIIDIHDLRGHVSVTVTAAINPPAIGRQ